MIAIQIYLVKRDELLNLMFLQVLMILSRVSTDWVPSPDTRQIIGYVLKALICIFIAYMVMQRLIKVVSRVILIFKLIWKLKKLKKLS